MQKRLLAFVLLGLCLPLVGAERPGAEGVTLDTEPQGETPAPLQEITELLAKGPLASQLPKLKDAYLKLQWGRLMGDFPGLMRPRRGVRVAPLTPDEKTRLAKWLDAKPPLKEKFLLALNAREDNLPAAARLALLLQEKYPQDSVTYENLLIAFAMVWDDPAIVYNLTRSHIPELRENDFDMCSPAESFGWYIKNARRLCPWLATTPWRLLKYVAPESSTLAERDWILSHYQFNPTLGTVYSDIVYDKSKLKDDHGKLGSSPYTLENLKKFGGVCRDQAFYARAVCRAFGLPAYMACGTGNAGGAHAWVGWVVHEGNGYKLLSEGRYSYDKYFTAEIVDPQSGKKILDYLVAIEAKALSDEKGYSDADFCYRLWEEAGPLLPAKTRNELLIAALQKNAYHRGAWLAIGAATASGELPPDSASKQWDYLNLRYKEFPDFIFAMMREFSAMLKTAQERYTFYETAAKVFVNLKRQDLVALLRVAEINMCVHEQRKDLAAQVAASAMQECAGEGAEGAALAKRGVELFVELGQPRAAIKPLEFTLAHMPKLRADQENPYWCDLTEMLRDLYKLLGDAKKVDSLNADLEKNAQRAKLNEQ